MIYYNGQADPNFICLATPDRRIMGVLGGVDETSCQVTKNAQNTYELTFDVYRYVNDDDSTVSAWYDHIEELMTLYVDGVWYIINEPTSVTNDGTMSEYMTVNAESAEIQLQHFDLQTFSIGMGTSESYEMQYYYDHEDDYSDGSFPVVHFYDPDTPELSLMHLVLYHAGLIPTTTTYDDDGNKVIEWTDNIDKGLWTIGEIDSTAKKTTTVEPVTEIIYSTLASDEDSVVSELSYTPCSDYIKVYCYHKLSPNIKTFLGEDGEDYWSYDSSSNTIELNFTPGSAIIKICVTYFAEITERYYLADDTYCFEVDNQDVYSFLTQDVSEAFGCIFFFDTVEKTISAYYVENIGEDTGVYIGWRNIQNSLSGTRADQLYTAVSVAGGDGLDNCYYANFGSSELEDYSFFMDTKWVPQTLIDKYNAWVEYKEELRPYYLQTMKNWYEADDVCEDLEYRVPDDGIETDWTSYEIDDLTEAYDNYTLLVSAYEALYVDSDGNTDWEAFQMSSDWTDYYEIVNYILPEIVSAIQNADIETQIDLLWSSSVNTDSLGTVLYELTYTPDTDTLEVYYYISSDDDKHTLDSDYWVCTAEDSTYQMEIKTTMSDYDDIIKVYASYERDSAYTTVVTEYGTGNLITNATFTTTEDWSRENGLTELSTYASDDIPVATTTRVMDINAYEWSSSSSSSTTTIYRYYALLPYSQWSTNINENGTGDLDLSSYTPDSYYVFSGKTYISEISTYAYGYLDYTSALPEAIVENESIIETTITTTSTSTSSSEDSDSGYDTGWFGIYQEDISVTNGEYYIWSIYVKSDTATTLRLWWTTEDVDYTTFQMVSPDDSTDTLGTTEISVSADTWQRISARFLISSDANQPLVAVGIFGDSSDITTFTCCAPMLELVDSSTTTSSSWGYFMSDESSIMAWETEWDLYGTEELSTLVEMYQGLWEELEDYAESDGSSVYSDYSRLHQMYLDYYQLWEEATAAYEERAEELAEAEAIRDGYQTEANEMSQNVLRENFGDVQDEYDGFTDSEEEILLNLYKHTDYTNENLVVTSITDSEATCDLHWDLWYDADDRLYALAHPQYTWEDTIDNVLGLEEFKDITEPLELFDYVHVEIDDDVFYCLRLIGMTYNPLIYDGDATLTFSTITKYKNHRDDFSDLLNQAIGAAEKNAISSITSSSDVDSITITSDVVKALLSNSTFTRGVSNITANTITANKIVTALLEADSAWIGELSVNVLTAGTATITTLYSDYIEANAANIAYLISDYIDATTIVSEEVFTEYLEANSAYIYELIAGSIQADYVEALIGSFTDLYTVNITGDYADFTEAEIDSLTSLYAEISKLISDSITAGDITTDFVTTTELYAITGTIEDLTATYLEVTGDADFDGDVTIQGLLTALQANINTIEANYISANDIETVTLNVSGELTANQALIAELVADYITADEIYAVTGTFDDLTAIYADITGLEADTITVAELFSYFVSTSVLEANYISTDDLEAIVANIEDLTSKQATISELLSDYIETTSLSVVKAEIKDLSSTYADITFINVDVASIVDAFVTDLLTAQGLLSSSATIDTLTVTGYLTGIGIIADYIQAGTLDCSSITVTNLDVTNLTVESINGWILSDEIIDADNLSDLLYDIIEALNTTSDEVANALAEAGLATTTISTLSSSTITDIAIQYYLSTSNTELVDGEWSYDVPTWTEGTYIWTRNIITYGSGATATSSAVCITGNTGANGSDGVSVTSVVNYYLKSTSATEYTQEYTDDSAVVDVAIVDSALVDVMDYSEWSTEVPELDEEYRYLWNFEVLYYSDGSYSSTTPHVVGVYGKSGTGIESITEYYTLTETTDIPSSGWDITVPTMTSTYKYLWNYEVIAYTDGDSESTDPVIIGVYGDTGNGISSVVNHYLATSESDGVTINTSGWTDEVQTVDATNRYLWNYETVYYTLADSVDTDPAIIGMYSEDGNGVESVTNYYLATSVSGGITSATDGWTDFVQEINSTNKYLWNYEVIKYTNSDDDTETEPHIISIYTEDGVGISSVTEYYALSSTTDAPEYDEFTSTIQEMDEENRYLWNYELIEYTDGDPTQTERVIIGVYGKTGRGIESVVEEYAVSTSNTETPDEWTEDLSEIELTSTNKYLWNRETIYYSDDTSETSDAVIIGVYGETGSSGTGISELIEYYGLSSDSSTEPESYSTNIPTMTSLNRYLWNYEQIVYTDGTTSDTSPVIIGIYGDTGSDGVGVSEIVEYYGLSTESTIEPESWSTDVPTFNSTYKYLWNYEETVYTDGTTTETSHLIIAIYTSDGESGSDGVSITSVVNYYARSTSNTDYTVTLSEDSALVDSAIVDLATTDTMVYEDWSTTAPELTSEYKYLWNFEIIYYSDGSYTSTDPHVVGVYGDTGNGISAVTNYYLATSDGENVTVDTEGWTDTVQTVDETNRYLWNYEKVYYTQTDAVSTDPAIIGTYSEDGVGIDSITEHYALSSEADADTDELSWSDTVLTVTSEYKYLWNYETVSYTDKKSVDTDPVIIGVYGDTGNGISDIINYYLATSESSGITIDTEGWTTTVQEIDATNKYLWNYEEIYYTDSDTPTRTDPHITGVYGESGTSFSWNLFTGTSDEWQEVSLGRYYVVIHEVDIADLDVEEGDYVVCSGYIKNNDDTAKTICPRIQFYTSDSDRTSLYDYSDNIDAGESTYFEIVVEMTAERLEYTTLQFCINNVSNSTVTTTETVYYKSIKLEYGDTASTWCLASSEIVGNSIESVTNYYLLSNESSGITVDDDGWDTEIQNVNEDAKYLWTYQRVTYSLIDDTYTDPYILTTYVTDGTDGQMLLGQSTTLATVPEKTATLYSGEIDELTTGTIVIIVFTYGNTTDETTLNIDDTGEFPIYLNGEAISSDNEYDWDTNSVITFVFSADSNDGNGAWLVADSGSSSAIATVTSIATSKATAYYAEYFPSTSDFDLNENDILYYQTTQQVELKEGEDGYIEGTTTYKEVEVTEMYIWTLYTDADGNSSYMWVLQEFGTDSISAGTITADLLAANTITASEIAAGTITADEIAAYTITAGEIEAASIATAILTSDYIQASVLSVGTDDEGTVTITNGKITADMIDAELIDGTKITSRSITADLIQYGTITGDEIDAVSISATILTAGCIKSDMIEVGAVDASKISVSDLSALGATIGGFNIGTTALYTNSETYEGDNNIYIGTGGISLGTTFSVSKYGALRATSGTIGAITLSSNGLYSYVAGTSSLVDIGQTDIALVEDSSGGSDYAGIYSPDTIESDTIAFFAGASSASGVRGNFYVTYGGILTATGANIEGTITATSGTIGGFTIGDTSIYSLADSYASTSNNIYIGTSGISLGTSFAIDNTGSLTATDANISGTITATTGAIGNFIIGGSALYYTSWQSITLGQYYITVLSVDIADTDLVEGDIVTVSGYIKNDDSGKTICPRVQFYTSGSDRTSIYYYNYNITDDGEYTYFTVSIEMTSEYLAYTSIQFLINNVTDSSITDSSTAYYKCVIMECDGVTLGTADGDSTFYAGSDGIYLGDTFSVTVGGVLTATSGTIGIFTLENTRLYSGKTSSTDTSNSGIYFGSSGTFCMGGTSHYVSYNGSTLAVVGKITATSGTIGGFTITDSSIYYGKTSVSSTTTGIYLCANGTFNFGSSSNYIKYSSSTLTIKGSITSTDGFYVLDDEDNSIAEMTGTSINFYGISGSTSTNIFHIGYDNTYDEDGEISSSLKPYYTIGSRADSEYGGYSVAEGYNTTASGYISHAEGYNTTASGYISHAEGHNTTASEVGAHAEGLNTTASAQNSHVEGSLSVASGIYSHSEGYNTTASGSATHAEGYITVASGNRSHAEGYHTTASGDHSHAEGAYTVSSGAWSHAEGFYTTAASSWQHVFGKYNVSDSSSKYVEIVGNGTSSSNQSNARTLDWDGNEILGGTLTCTSVSQTSDIRAKTNIVDLDNRYLSLLDNLHPVTFQFIKDQTYHNNGFIAQEVIEQLEEIGLDIDGLIRYDEQKDQYCLDYNGIIAILVAGYQDLRNQVNNLIKGVK